MFASLNQRISTTIFGLSRPRGKVYVLRVVVKSGRLEGVGWEGDAIRTKRKKVDAVMYWICYGRKNMFAMMLSFPFIYATVKS